jgi:hypothetical protein
MRLPAAPKLDAAVAHASRSRLDRSWPSAAGILGFTVQGGSRPGRVLDDGDTTTVGLNTFGVGRALPARLTGLYHVMIDVARPGNSSLTADRRVRDISHIEPATPARPSAGDPVTTGSGWPCWDRPMRSSRARMTARCARQLRSTSTRCSRSGRGAPRRRRDSPPRRSSSSACGGAEIAVRRTRPSRPPTVTENRDDGPALASVLVHRRAVTASSPEPPQPRSIV